MDPPFQTQFFFVCTVHSFIWFLLWGVGFFYGTQFLGQGGRARRRPTAAVGPEERGPRGVRARPARAGQVGDCAGGVAALGHHRGPPADPAALRHRRPALGRDRWVVSRPRDAVDRSTHPAPPLHRPTTPHATAISSPPPPSLLPISTLRRRCAVAARTTPTIGWEL